MRWVLLLMLLPGGLGLTGCVREKVDAESQAALFGTRTATPPDRTASKVPPQPAPAVIVTPAIGDNGRITSVNPTARYVVISYLAGVPLPGIDRRLNVYRDGLKVAEIRITGPSGDTLTIGDIVAGECRSGDEARED